MKNLNAMHNGRKVVVLGLDGATFDLIKPWVDEGKLSNLSHLMKNGVWGNLRSVIPTTSAPAWVSFMTGKNPGKHGIFDFVAYPDTGEGKSRLISSLSFKDKTLWEILSLHGKGVGVVNVPITYPPKKVNGFLISCFMTPPSAKVFTYPEELRQEIPDYSIDLDFVKDWLFKDETVPQKVNKSEMLQEQYDITEKRASVVLKLIGKWETDFFIVVFKGTDNLQHYFWDEKGILLEYYQKLDKAIKEILDSSGKETNTFIISDHGFGPEAAKIFFINTWLEQQGLLKMKEGNKNRVFRKLFPAATQINQFLRFSTMLPRRIVNQVVKASKSQIDWSNTEAYGDDKGIRGININIKGRQPAGIVETEEYEQFRGQIINKLKALKDPETGESIMKEVYKKEELYSGRFMNRIPDIILLANHKYITSSGISDKLVKPSRSVRSGNHANGYIDGVFVANGPDIKEGKQTDGVRLIDLAPTIIHMLGIPVPEDMDGRVLREVFREGSEPAQREVKYERVSVEREKVKNRIAHLKGTGKI